MTKMDLVIEKFKDLAENMGIDKEISTLDDEEFEIIYDHAKIKSKKRSWEIDKVKTIRGYLNRYIKKHPKGVIERTLTRHCGGDVIVYYRLRTTDDK